MVGHDSLEEAVALAKAGRRSEARQIATRLVKKQPENAAAWVVLAQVVDTRDQAIDCLKQVLRLDPGHPWASLHLKRLMEQNRRPASPPPAADVPKRSAAPARDNTPLFSDDLDFGDLAPTITGSAADKDLDPLAGTRMHQRPPSSMDVDTFDALREQLEAEPAKGKKKKQKKEKKQKEPGAKRRRNLAPLVILLLLCLLTTIGAWWALENGYLEQYIPSGSAPAGQVPVEAPATEAAEEAQATDEATIAAPSEEAAALPFLTPTASQAAPAAAGAGAEGPILFVRDTGGAADLFVITAEGSGLEPVTQDAAVEAGFGVAWSPDGARIAFVSMADPDGDGAPAADIMLVNADGSDPVNLTGSAEPDFSPVWSPDGRYLAFVTTQDEATIGLIDVELALQGDPNAITLAAPGAFPAWSPDGEQIAYSRGGQTDSDLWLLDVECALGVADCEINPTQLTVDASGSSRPQWSPEGSQIAYLSAGGGLPELWIINPDGSGAAPLSDTGQQVLTFAWSPDGTRLAFDVMNVESADMDIYLINADGSEQTALVEGPGLAVGPSWSPDGSRIAFTLQADLLAGTSEITLINADGSGITALTQGDALDLAPLWQP